jgi:hypothetical protein
MPGFIHTLVIERPFGVDVDLDATVDVDQYGQPVRTFDTTFATVKGLIQPKTDREIALASQAGADVGDHTIYMARTDITTSDRLRATDGSVYQVRGIRDHNFGNLAHMAIDAQRVQSAALVVGS